MRKERDYCAENQRSRIGQAVQRTVEIFGKKERVTHYEMTKFMALRRLLGEEAAQKAAQIIGERDQRKLVEIARVSPADALAIIEEPEITDKPYAIEYVYEKLEERIQAAKRRRVSADDRIRRAWPGYWQRWLAKFDAADHDMVRSECSDLILMELMESKRAQKMSADSQGGRWPFPKWEQKGEAGWKKIVANLIFCYSLSAMICRRPRSNATALSSQGEAILGWMRLGAGVWCAAIQADVPVCRALAWIEEGTCSPSGIHGEFARQMKELQAANQKSRSTNSGISFGLPYKAGLPGKREWQLERAHERFQWPRPAPLVILRGALKPPYRRSSR